MGKYISSLARTAVYQQQLFEGGGELSSKRTMICTDCTEVVDVLTWFAADAPPEWIQQATPKMGRCPKCEGANLKDHIKIRNIDKQEINEANPRLTTLDAAERAPQSAKGFGLKARAR